MREKKDVKVVKPTRSMYLGSVPESPHHDEVEVKGGSNKVPKEASAGITTVSKSYSLPPRLVKQLEYETAKINFETGSKRSVSKLVVELLDNALEND